ncbi:leader peptidase (prepilin peptidase) / N-methyltransferase [Micromonospora narathiwatensis]|uniref:Leader peptidase (Prepilin peptidase) / N-methyltransferase n=1 Tax=Micromonospora narathiwatensis TaxID=299146 RepID=A0A1A8Z977_9ACTN|nr:leader peptidase (prepilin peptidase) / N-methyltransferase [Micromonospora narathiwatensis]
MRWLVVRLTVPAGQASRRTCGRCGVEVSPTGPGWTALLPGGRCGRYRHRVGAVPYLLELCVAVAVVIVVLAAPTIPVMLAGLWWAGCAVPLAFIDAQVHRLPDVLTLPAAAGVLVLLTVDAAASGSWDRLLSAAICAIVSALVFLSLGLVLGSRGMGLGDTKLLFSLTALLGWWGWGSALGGVLLGFLGSGLAGVVLLASRRAHPQTQIPMGPFLIAGALLMFALLAQAPSA